MQQRKLNKRFLMIVSSVVGGSIIAAVAGGTYLFRGTSEKHIKMAELYLRERRVEDAAQEYKLAISLDRSNAELYVKLGDVYQQLAASDAAYAQKNAEQWKMALQVDPTYLPAMQRLLDRYLEDIRYNMDPWVLNAIRDICGRILPIDPNDNKARASLHTSWLQGWLAGFETRPEQVEQSLKELAILQEKDPANIEIPWIIARAQLMRASELTAASRYDESKIRLADAEQAMQRSVTVNSESAKAHLYYHEVLLSLGNYHRSDPDKRKSYRSLAASEVLRAQELAKKDATAYVDVNLAAARFAQQDQQMDKAQTIFKDMLSERMDDRFVRLEAAKFYMSLPEKRQEAITLLEDNLSEDRNNSMPRAMKRELELQSYITLCNLRIALLAASTNDDEKKELTEKIEHDLAQVNNHLSGTPREWTYLKLQGRLYQTQGKNVDAIQKYSRAASMVGQLGTRSGDVDDMMYQLAQAYFFAQQTGEARQILEDLVKRYGEIVPARILLARILLMEGNTEAAMPHLRFLEQAAPKDPQVVPLLLQAAVNQKNSNATKDLMSRLPEGTREEKLNKARVAIDARQFVEVQRLTQAVQSKNAGDEEAAQIAAQSMLVQGKNADAGKIIDAALKANPGSSALKLAKARLEGNGEQEMGVLTENLDEIKDEFTRELAKAGMADRQGKAKEALDHLKKAEQIKPDAPEIWDMMFQYYARQKQWDQLQPYLVKLVEANHDRANGLLYQFRLAQAKGEQEKAVDLAKQMVVKLPEFAQSWLSLGQGLAASHRYEEARDAFLRVREKQAANVEAYRGLVECSYGLRRFEDAGRYISEGRQRIPGSIVLRNMEIEYELSFGDPSKVVGTLESQLQAQRDREQAWILLGRAYDRIVQKKVAKGDADAAEAAKKARTHWAAASAKWPDNSELLAAYADACMGLGDREAAREALQKHLDKVQDRIEPILMMAEYQMRVSQPSHAEMILRKGLERFADKVELWQRLATVQAAQGKVDDAIKTLSSAPQTADIMTQKLEVLMQFGKFPEAKELIQQVIKSKGQDFALINAQAYIAIQEKDLKAAHAYVENSLSLKPDNAIALHQRALIKLKDSPADVDGAIVDLKTAIQQSPQSIEIRMTAADAYLSRRDMDGAIRELEVAAGLAPRNKAVWMRLLDIYMASQPGRLNEAKALVDRVKAAGVVDLDLLLRSARILMARRETVDAAAEMQRAVEVSGNREEVVRVALFMLLDMGQGEQAAKQAREVLKSGADSWWVHHVLAVASARKNAADVAISEWDKALVLTDKAKDEGATVAVMQGLAREMGVAKALPPVLQRAGKDPRWMVFAASLYRIQGDFANAMSMADQAMGKIDKLVPDDQTHLMQEAGAIYLSADPPAVAKGIAVYERLLERQPEDLATLNNLACLYVDNVQPSDPKRALEYSRRAYLVMRKLNISEPLVMDTHGWVLAKAGQIQEGIVLLQEVVQRKPFLESRYHLAEAYLLGNYGEPALRQLNDAATMIADADRLGKPVSDAMKAKIADATTRATALAKLQAAQESKKNSDAKKTEDDKKAASSSKPREGTK